MTKISTDTHEFTISIIIHGDLEILNPVYPTAVESGEEFNIEYDVKNNGNNDTCYGEIVDLGTSNIMTGSDWQTTINAGSTIHRTYTVSGGITTDLSAKIDVGYVK